jgi:hypothetical protein
LHARLPFEQPKTAVVDETKWGIINFDQLTPDQQNSIYLDNGNSPDGIVPMMHSSGKISIFYNWWLNKKNPENYFKVDLGVCYVETRELAYTAGNGNNNWENTMFTDGVEGLTTYKPSEAMDWLYFKLEYRNQATWPFGASIQIANQTLLGNVWVPIVGNWLLLEMKYTTILRDPRPYEIKNFLMFSPVIRITI